MAEPHPFLLPPPDIGTAVDEVEASAVLVDHAQTALFDLPTAWERFGIPPQPDMELWLVPLSHRVALKRAIELLRFDIVALHRRFLELQAESDALFAISDEACDQAWDRTQNAAADLTERSLEALPTTLPGAVAALAWARWEFGRHYVETVPEPDWMDRWTLAMLDAALGVLRAQAGVS